MSVASDEALWPLLLTCTVLGSGTAPSLITGQGLARSSTEKGDAEVSARDACCLRCREVTDCEGPPSSRPPTLANLGSPPGVQSGGRVGRTHQADWWDRRACPFSGVTQLGSLLSRRLLGPTSLLGILTSASRRGD